MHCRELPTRLFLRDQVLRDGLVGTKSSQAVMIATVSPTARSLDHTVKPITWRSRWSVELTSAGGASARCGLGSMRGTSHSQRAVPACVQVNTLRYSDRLKELSSDTTTLATTQARARKRQSATAAETVPVDGWSPSSPRTLLLEAKAILAGACHWLY
jgi:hypothetical protein